MSIILNHVNRIYEKGSAMEVAALKDISLTIEDGAFIGLIGHTGSGKSTLIQHLNGLIRPTSGEIFFDGKDIWDEEYDRKALRSKVGLVFQYPEHQLFEVSVFADVCFGPKNMGCSKKETELRAYEALKMVRMPDELFYVSPFELSGGQKRRAAIAGVLAMKPKVLILDEPTAGLDPLGRVEILNLIKRLHEELSMTVILVSHSMEDVADYVERILVMNRGGLMLDGAPQEVFANAEELKAVGLSVPVVTNVLQTLRKEGYSLPAQATTVSEAADEIMALYGKGMG